MGHFLTFQDCDQRLNETVLSKISLISSYGIVFDFLSVLTI